MKKSSAIVLATVVGIGGLAAAAAVPAVAVAANSGVLAPVADGSSSGSQGLDGDRRDGDRPDPVTVIRGALDGLVSEGTITAAQADAVAAALAEKLPRGGGPHGPGMRGPGPALDVLADALGMTPDEVRAALMDGTSVADLAQEKGVALATVVDALVAEAKAHLDEEVAEGDLTQQEADERLEEIRTRIGEMVQQSGVPGPGHRGGMGGPGRGGHHGMGGTGMGDRNGDDGDA